MNDPLRSPISRHPTMSRLHWLTFTIHDLSSVGFLLVVFAREQIFAPGLLLVSVLSGVWLIIYRRRKGISSGHLTKTVAVSGIIVNQGLAVAVLGWVLYFPATLGNSAFVLLSVGICLHAFWAIARTTRLLCSEDLVENRFAESTLQLIYMIAAPNVVFFSLFAVGIWSRLDTGLVTGLLVFECVPGLAFSLAHDRKWVWGKQGLTRWQREVICLLPYAWLTYVISTIG